VWTCPTCGEVRPTLNRSTAPNIQLSSVSNQMYNNGMGKYDPGAGQVFHNRQEHKAWMESAGVTDFRGSQDDFMDKATADLPVKEISVADVQDAFQESSNEVRNEGRKFEDKPNPNPELTQREVI
jgi:hypothetical protein